MIIQWLFFHRFKRPFQKPVPAVVPQDESVFETRLRSLADDVRILGSMNIEHRSEGFFALKKSTFI